MLNDTRNMKPTLSNLWETQGKQLISSTNYKGEKKLKNRGGYPQIKEILNMYQSISTYKTHLDPDLNKSYLKKDNWGNLNIEYLTILRKVSFFDVIMVSWFRFFSQVLIF